MRKFIAPFIVLVAFAVHCGSTDAAPSPQQGAATERTIGVTHVTHNADGTDTVTHTYVTPADVDAMLASRAKGASPTQQTGGTGEDVGSQAQAITNDTGCSSGDVILYNATLGFGICHPNGTFYQLICFTGQGAANLHNYTYRIGTATYYWDTNVRSVEPGNEDGYLEFDPLTEFNTWSGGGACFNTTQSDWSEVDLTD